MLKQLKNIWQIAWNHDIRVMRVAIAAGSILWAVFLFNDGHTFDRPVYHVMASFASEETWATLFLVHGLMLLAQSARPDDFPTWYKLCVNTFGCVLWTATHASMMIYPYPAAITPGLVMTFMSWWLMVRTETRYTRRKTDKL
jgi:uncharacterized protein YhhL (DUF1145 family)